jgi:heme oxygenase
MHQELDERVAYYDLADHHQYASFLQASAAALIGIEQLLESSGVESLLVDWPQRQRAALIRADLAQLQVSCNPYQLRRAPPTNAEMMGMLYVLEGSRLGARLLLQRVLASNDDTVRSATRYLGANNPTLWRSFLELLETSADADDQAQTNAGAIYAFALFQRSFANASQASQQK